MKISSKGEYSLRALITLGENAGKVMTVAEISALTKLPSPYLEKILIQLKQLGYITSKRGFGGGYRLSQNPKNICIGEVIRKIEGPLAPMGCVSVTSYEPCSLESSCSLKPLWGLVRDTVAHVLENITLEDLVKNKVTEKEDLLNGLWNNQRK
ncbi:RrF2 family transcriptional regulator [Alkalihalobacterium alkalinitrilicum]|uniref:RrF2 family transcriptional regulator n=1 Tax=Alkalihalobacterium alkalinitrilicum TaxID=427920 RepID=UPI000994CB73|nr:Rrf2 family transcriptional regulator [Alkalihalobacterium alkalinitrilicum]